MFLVYSLLFTLGVIVTAPYYLWRLRGHILSGTDWRERLGFLPDSFQQPRPAGETSGTPCLKTPGTQPDAAIWIHAVSVGETLAIVRLTREIRRQPQENGRHQSRRG